MVRRQGMGHSRVGYLEDSSLKQLDLYLSGPMTGVVNLNRPAFMKAAKALRKRGYTVVNPPELDYHEPQRSWEGCLRRDIGHLLKCKNVATLPRWTKSRGANLEVHIAKALKFAVHPVKYYLKRRIK
jgi:hypothetical protein